MRRTQQLYLGWAAAVLAFSLSGCGSKHETQTDRASAAPLMRVSVQKAEAKPRSMTEETVATVQARSHATLESKLNGRIEQMPVALGEEVQKGQLIARLDAGEITARVEQAQAALDQAEQDWKRISGLFEQHSATQFEYDAAQARLRVAKGAAAEAAAIKENVEIIAPFDGVVARKWAEVGDLATPGKPLIEIEDPSALQLEAHVPEAIASHIHRGAQMEIRSDAYTNEFTGIVREVSPSADSISRTFQVKLDLPQPKGLRSGQFARLIVPIGESISLRVPASAVVQRGQLEILFVLENQRARMHLVKTGKRIGNELEILSGVDSGDLVIVSDASQLIDGQPVEVQ